jgi:hypothetical protein
LFLAERGAIALLISFSFMPRTMKSKSIVNNSSGALPSAHETGTPVFIRLEPSDIIKFVEELAKRAPGKIDLHVIVQHTTHGDNVIGNAILRSVGNGCTLTNKQP